MKKTIHLEHPEQLTKKIKAYSVVAGVVIAFAPEVSAEIHRTNIDPDLTFSNDGAVYNLDLNNDGVVDFKIRLYAYNSISSSSGDQYIGDIGAVLIEALNNNAVNAFNSTFIGTSGSTSEIYVANALNAFDPIKNGLNWVNNYSPYSSSSSAIILGADIYAASYGNIYWDLQIGPWLGVSDKYLGLKLSTSEGVLYGWARLDVSKDGKSFTIKDYAYEDIPNKPIYAGTGVANINTVDINNNVSVYSFGNKIFVNSIDLKEANGTITVLNNLGQVVNSSDIINAQTIITLENIKSGIYFVRIEMSKGIITKKVFIEEN